MDEETTRKVAMKYFESQGMKPIPQRGSGPDFLINGMAVEVKGSECARASETKRMLKQIIDYTYKYSEVSLFLPIDGLTLKSAIQLEALGFLLANAGRKSFDVYIVVEAVFNNRAFFVAKYQRVYNNPARISTIFEPQFLIRIEENEPFDIFLNKVEPLISWNPVEAVKKQFEKASIHENKATVSGLLFGREWSVVII